MFVRMWMTKDVITVPPEMPILEARDVMKQHMVRRLPVLKKGKLVGLITQGDIQEAGPSGATSLSIWELNYLLARITVEETMTPADNLITVSPDETIEQAALLMRKHKVGSLPVLDKHKLVGIITESDIFGVLIEVMGIRRDGTRLTLELEDRPGALAEALNVIKSYEVNVLSVVTCDKCPHEEGYVLIVIRMDHYDWRPIVKDLKDKGINVIDART